MKSFTAWLYKNDRLRTDPLKSTQRDAKGERIDKRYQRRALTEEEILKLLRATRTGKTFKTLTGEDRFVIYQLALETGLRVNEIRTLTPSAFNLQNSENATITVLAAYSKHRRDDVLPLRKDLAKLLADYIDQSMKLPNARLFNLPERTAKMINADLKAANIDTEENDQIIDFHSLRHTFITRLTRSGVSPKTAQSLARHSTITLTMDRYTHVLNGKLWIYWQRS